MADRSEEARARARLVRQIRGYRESAVVYVAAALGIADHLADGTKGTDELARATGAHAPTLLRIMRALVVQGLAEEVTPGRFSLTAAGALLRRDAPGGLRAQALAFGGDTLHVWSRLLHTARTGETTFDHVHGEDGFSYFARDPAVSRAFNDRMAAGTREAIPAILAALDFAPFATVVDVGGGDGTLISEIAKAHPALRGIVSDSSAAAVEHAPAVFEQAGVADRCGAAHMDFFEQVPEGGDAYVLKSVIHDWDDARALTILKNVRRVIPAAGRLIVMEPVMPERVERAEPGISIVAADLNMLVNTGGRERTEPEFRALFADAGFRLTRIVPTDSPWPLSVLEGVVA
jgi:ubiquinone/menaquinone biosynthesis C-methylase UbiE